MKRYRSIAAIILLSILLCSCGSRKAADGIISTVEKTIGESDIYSAEDIDSAMQAVLDVFSKEFRRCTLKELAYDEDTSIAESGRRAEEYSADKIIVLISSFDVDSVELEDGLIAGSSYTDWLWILTRSENEVWTVQDWGY